MILFEEIRWQVPSVQVYSLECFCAEVVSRKLFFFPLKMVDWCEMWSLLVSLLKQLYFFEEVLSEVSWWRDVYQPLAVVYKVESLEARQQRNRRVFGCRTPWPYKPLQMPYYLVLNLARAKRLEQKKADVLLEGLATLWLPCYELKPHVNSVAISMFRVPVILEKHLVSNNQKTQQCNCRSL